MSSEPAKINNKEAQLATLIDTPAAVSTLINTLLNLPNNPPSLYLDLEGIKLSRHGSISLLQIHVLPTKETHLIDIHTLGITAFTTPGETGETLKTILESPSITKAFFDVRNDSDALFAHFNISLSGIIDIQLMELATRDYSKKYLNGLAKCIEKDLLMTAAERQACMLIKNAGVKLFVPELGGSREVFNERPLAKDVILYCMQDVQLLPRLWALYMERLSVYWARRVEDATKDRVRMSQAATYNSEGLFRTLGPW